MKIPGWIKDFFYPDWCACGEKMIGGKFPLSAELGDDCGGKV